MMASSNGRYLEAVYRPTWHVREVQPTITRVAYDVQLAGRIRERLSATPGVSERKMFGGLAFMVNGHMAIAASAKGGVMVRVDPERSDRLVARTPAELVVMRGRSMPGWLRVQANDVRTARQLGKWVERSVAYTLTLAPKKR